METIQLLKNKLVERIMLSNNEELLDAIDSILEQTKPIHKYELTEEQKEMLLMSEADVKYGRIVSDEEVYKQDELWMK